MNDFETMKTLTPLCFGKESDADWKNSALCLAVENGHTEVVRALLAVCPSRVLSLSTHKGHKERTHEGHEAGAKVHVEHDKALRYAAENGHVEIVKMLLNAGADVRAEDNDALWRHPRMVMLKW